MFRHRQNKYSGLSYRELLDQMDSVHSNREARMLHRALKGYGSGLRFRDRYLMGCWRWLLYFAAGCLVGLVIVLALLV